MKSSGGSKRPLKKIVNKKSAKLVRQITKLKLAQLEFIARGYM